MTATPKGLRVLWANLEGKTDDGQRVHQVMDSRTPGQTRANGEGGIREGQPNSVNAMSVFSSQTRVSGKEGNRERQTYQAKGNRIFAREFLTSIQVFYVASSTFSTRPKSTSKSVKGWPHRLLLTFYLLVS